MQAKPEKKGNGVCRPHWFVSLEILVESYIN
jgi:hypothetical protein